MNIFMTDSSNFFADNLSKDEKKRMDRQMRLPQLEQQLNLPTYSQHHQDFLNRKHSGRYISQDHRPFGQLQQEFGRLLSSDAIFLFDPFPAHVCYFLRHTTSNQATTQPLSCSNFDLYIDLWLSLFQEIPDESSLSYF